MLLDRCGNALTSQSVGPKILWLKEQRPELYGRTAMVLTSTSYLTWKLTGEYAIDHYTAANFSPLYDVGRLAWTSDLADFLPLDRLPGAEALARAVVGLLFSNRHRRLRRRAG